MIVVLSGEGPTDIGCSGSGDEMCRGEGFLPGPMAWMVDHLIESGPGNKAGYGYSVIETEQCVFVSKSRLDAVASRLKVLKKGSPTLPGRKKALETAFFFKNARALAVVAAEEARASKDDDVIAVLFRDSDKLPDRVRWEDKHKSMENGFAVEGFRRGVPMLPKPKSEAWLLCALRENPYTGCESLEERSGNDDSPNDLKTELAELLGDTGGRDLREVLADLVTTRQVDVTKLTMSSFVAFRSRLLEVLHGSS